MSMEPNTLNVIDVKPDLGSAYGNGWKRLWKNFLELLLALIITWAFSIPTIIWSNLDPVGAGYGVFSFFYNILVMLPLGYGMYYVYLQAARGEKVEISGVFEGFRTYWNTVGAGLLTGIIIVVGLIFLIVPGIIFACKLAFVPYLVVDRKMGPVEAIKTSWDWTSGHAGEIFLMGLLAIPIMIAGFICLGVGAIPASMWITLAFASMYHAVSLEKDSNVAYPSPVIT